MNIIINENQKKSNGLKSRELVIDILIDIIEKGANPDQSLKKKLQSDKYLTLPKEDIAFCMMIMMTTLRRWGHIEIILAKYLKNSIESHSRRIHFLLLTSVCQILYLNTPPYAAVNSAIELTKNDKKSSKLRGLVNAVLRRISDDKDTILSQIMNPLDLLPDWIRDRWKNFYTNDEIKTISDTLLSSPPLDISLKDYSLEVIKDLNGSVLSTGSIRLHDYSYIPNIKFYNEGLWWIQDVSASIPIKLIEDNLKDKLFVDLCAAPGGKTASLLSKGAIVVAVDKSAERLKILKENLDRLKYKAKIVHADGTIWFPKEKVDGVLIDAPCSSTGVIRRNPDILRRKINNLEFFTHNQEKLLNNGINMLKVGGILIYCTCSLEPEEGEDQINRILKERTDIKLRKIILEKLPEFKKSIRKEGFMRILPGILPDGGNDGFFISILEKK
ncbi:MAG: RsmB/NOP family class I SAM-dependent RNA methyltransferase [Hyphomicrobiales bacterium]|nr:RsmB/NOP family class I SAM-dependent RNA methyltransferase [Hyphomicrobiales bacterium]